MLSFNSDFINIDIVGRWKVEDNGALGFMTFDSEGYASMEFEGKKMGGKNFLYEGKKAKMTYSLNTEKNPVKIDVIVTSENNEILRTMYGIIVFKDENNMKLAASFDSPERPTEFNDDNTINLTRILKD